MYSKALVIGGRGYIGTVLVSKLKERNVEVMVVDDNRHQAINFGKNKEDISVDWWNYEGIKLFNPDIIFNLVGDVHIAKQEQDWSRAVKGNITPLLNSLVFDKPIIWCSSIAYKENSNYGKSKFVGEEILKVQTKDYKISRPCTVIGSYEDMCSNPETNHILDNAMKCIIKGEILKLYRNGGERTLFQEPVGKDRW